MVPTSLHATPNFPGGHSHLPRPNPEDQVMPGSQQGLWTNPSRAGHTIAPLPPHAHLLWGRE